MSVLIYATQEKWLQPQRLSRLAIKQGNGSVQASQSESRTLFNDPQTHRHLGRSQRNDLSLTEDEIVVGREPSNPICLNDLSVSRRHCLIKRGLVQPESETREAAFAGSGFRSISSIEPRGGGHQFTIIDLESFNGTFVNGVPVKEQALAHGDQIAVGDVVLLFLLHETEAGTKAAIQVERGWI